MNKQTITCENVDMDQLHQQKQELVELIWKDKDSKLWGLVHLIDAIEDSTNQKTKKTNRKKVKKWLRTTIKPTLK